MRKAFSASKLATKANSSVLRVTTRVVRVLFSEIQHKEYDKTENRKTLPL